MVAPINGHFLHAKKLERIYITNQAFHSMKTNVFEGASNLQWLYLEHNIISSVVEGTFGGLRTLKKLSLQGNQLQSFPAKTFTTLLDLEFLNLKNNLLTSLPAKIFKDNNKLKTILLDVNRLLLLPALELPGEYDMIQLEDNLCVNEVFHHTNELNKVVGKSCNIPLSPSKVLDAYKRQEENPHNCDDKDKDKLLKLADDIRILNLEIEQIKEEKERLGDVLESVSSVSVCNTRAELWLNWKFQRKKKIENCVLKCLKKFNLTINCKPWPLKSSVYEFRK